MSEKSKTNEYQDEIDTNAFLTDLPDATGYIGDSSPSEKLLAGNAKGIPTKMGLVGELDVIDGIMDRMRAKTKKINPDSPRTKQALVNLGISKDECVVKKYENFEMASKNEKMKKLLYIYYIGHVNDTIVEVLQERDTIKQQKKGKKSVGGYDLEPMTLAPDRSFPVSVKSSRTHFAFIEHDKQLERLTEKNMNVVHTIERQAMNFLESERDYLKRLNIIKKKMEKAEVNKKQVDEKKQVEIAAKKEEYNKTVEKAKEMERVRAQTQYKQWRKMFSPHSQSSAGLKEHFMNEMRVQTEEHRMREAEIVENQRLAQLRITKRDQESLKWSDEKMAEIMEKDERSKAVLEREKEKRQSMFNTWNSKFMSTRDNVMSPKTAAENNIFNRYAEKMQRFEKGAEKLQIARQEQLNEKKKQTEEHMKDVKRKLKEISKTASDKEAEFAEKQMRRTTQLESFFGTKQQITTDKGDLNRFRLQRSQIHFEKVNSDMVHKANVIMNKNRVLTAALEQRSKERETVRTASIKHRLNLKLEKESLNGHLEQVGKVQMVAENVARKFMKQHAPFNMQNMAEFISQNFRKTPELVKQNTEVEH